MNWLDLLIVAVVAVSTATAFLKGFLLELFSLGGVVLGFVIAGLDYGRLAPWILRWVSNPELSDLIAFLLIALGTMILAGWIGRLLRGTVRRVGLGFLDRLLGAVFGLLRGLALVTLMVIALAAFLPQADCLRGSRLTPMFLTAAHGGSKMTPFELGERIRQGIDLIRAAQPRWLHSSTPYAGRRLTVSQAHGFVIAL